jgi:hypothetical protein
MNIIKNRNETTTFEKLNNGDVFTTCYDRRYFMVIKAFVSIDGSSYNCVSLHDGEMNFMGDDETVIKVDCDLVIK